MNIPQLHTNLLWDLSCLIIFLTGLYFSCIIFFRSSFWKSVTTSTLLEWADLGKFHIRSSCRDKQTKEIRANDHESKLDRSENIDTGEVVGGKSILDIEVDYEEVIDPGIEQQIHEILESYAKGQREKEIIFYNGQESGNGHREDRFDFGNVALPTAKFYSIKENSRVKLLHTIAELGDIREVPLLQEMLDQERNESISILIKEIILGFLSEVRTDSRREPQIPKIGHLYEHYVYKHLFRSLDMESQYLLLDEIHKIGGEEELTFLRSLSLHPDGGIREKARSIGDRLEQRLRPLSQDMDISESELSGSKKNRSRISFVLRVVELCQAKLKGMGTRVSAYIIRFFSHPSKGDNMGNKCSEPPVLKGISSFEDDILRIDFELDLHDKED